MLLLSAFLFLPFRAHFSLRCRLGSLLTTIIWIIKIFDQGFTEIKIIHIYRLFAWLVAVTVFGCVCLKAEGWEDQIKQILYLGWKCQVVKFLVFDHSYTSDEFIEFWVFVDIVLVMSPDCLITDGHFAHSKTKVCFALCQIYWCSLCNQINNFESA